MKLFKKPMKLLSFLLLLIVMFSIGTGNVFADATYWQTVGTSGFSDGVPSYLSIVADGDTPYVAYREPTTEIATVKKFDGANWVTVGNLPKCYSAASVELALDTRTSPGTLYVFFSDDTYFGRGTVKKLVGSSWVNVGNPGFSESSISEQSMVIDNDGTPYVAYKDYLTGYVKKFDGTNWVLVGGANFGTATDCISLAIDKSTTPHTPYVAYLDWSWPDARHGRATVKKLVGSSWVNVGNLGEGPATFTNLVVDNGIPIIAYRDGSNTRTTVNKFNGSSWEPVGGGIISEGDSNFINMVLDSSTNPGTLYVTYCDNKNGSRATVRKFDGTNWATVGNAGFSADMVGYIYIAVGPNGKSFVVYRDSVYSYKPTVSESIVRHNLTYTAAGNGSISGDASQIVSHGGSGKPVSAVPAGGHHFVSWSDGSTNPARTDSNLMADRTFYATFAINTYTLTYTVGANGSITGNSPQTVNHGGNGTEVTAVPAQGYHFVKWSDNSIQNPRTDTNVSGNKNVSASFEINTYTLTYAAEENGYVTGASPQTVNYGGNGIAVTAVPAQGYHFVKWSDNSIQNPRTDTNITGAINVSASFALNAVSSENSTVTVDKPTVTVGDYDNAAITVTLEDVYNNPAVGRTVILTQESGSSSISPLSTTSDGSGVAAFTVTDTKAETVTYSVTADGVLLAHTVQVNFTNGAAKSLMVEAPATKSAGEPFGAIVTVQDEYGNTVTDYSGTIRLSSDNGNSPGGMGPELPEDYIFTLGDAGVHTFNGITLYNAALSTLTATDTANGTIVGISGDITVSPGPVSMNKSTLTAGKEAVTADDTDSTTITAALKDEYGNPVSGESVELLQGYGNSNITTANDFSDEAGIVTFTVMGTKAEQIVYNAMTGGKALSQTVTVNFVHGPLEKLKVDANVTQKAGAPFGITVTAQDHYGNTIIDYAGTVRFTSTDGAAVLPANYKFEAADNGKHTFAGTVLKTAGKQAVMAADIDVSSVTGTTGEITVETGESYAGQSTVVASKSTVTADGTDSTQITVTLTDDYGNLVSGKSVILEQGDGSSIIEAVYGITGTDGIEVFNITNTKAEQVTYTAEVNGEVLNQTAQVTFVHGQVESFRVIADGTQKAGVPFSVTVTAQDHYGNLVSDYVGNVMISTNNGTSPGGEAPSLPAVHVFSLDDEGSYTYVDGVTLYNAAESTLTAIDTDDAAITGTLGSIAVEPGSINAGVSTVEAVNTTVTADGTDSTIIKVVLKDEYGNFVSGETVELEQGSGSTEITIVNDVADMNGTAIFTVGSTKAEEVTYTASAGGIALSQTAIVNFIPGSLEGLKISTGSVQRAGVPFSVTITAQDSNGNTVKDYKGTVSLTTDNGSSPNGMEPSLPEEYTFELSDEGTYTFEDEIILYNAVTSSLTVTDAAYDDYTRTKNNIIVNPAGVDDAASEVEASQASVIADGMDSSEITVVLKDAYGNLVSSRTVALLQGGGSSVITPASAISGLDGVARFTVKSTRAEEVDYTVAVNGAATSRSIDISFEAGPVDAVHSSLAASKLEAAADGKDSSTITVTLKDAFGNTVSGETVVLDQGAGSSSIVAINSVSDKDGKASFTVSNDSIEAVIYTAEAGGTAISQAVTINFLPVHNVKVSAEPSAGGTVNGGGSYAEGRTVTVKASPRSGYNFINWTENDKPVSTNNVYTFTMGISDRLLTANFRAVQKPDNDEDAGGVSSGASTQPTPGNTPAPTRDNTGNANITASPELDRSTGTATTEFAQNALSDAFSAANVGSNGVKTVSIEIPKVEGAKAYESTLPASFVSSSDSTRKVEIKTELGEVTVPGNMLSEAAASGAQNVSLTIAAVVKSGLDPNLQTQLGSKPIIELNLEIDGQKTSWSNETAPVTVSISYIPTAEELKDPEHITVWYIDGSGNAISVPSGRYDPATGRVTFSTTHFSRYAVAYVRKSFNDLDNFSWAQKQIEVLASKGIIYNNSETNYLPVSNITRADYLAMLVKTLGLSANFNSNFDDVKTGAYYYKEVGIARALGITSGTGSNKFNPDSPISRQDMMVMTVKALSIIKKLNPNTGLTNLDKYDDKVQIASYAAGSMDAMVEAGFIEGSGRSIRPLACTSRAEAAVLLYRIYNFK